MNKRLIFAGKIILIIAILFIIEVILDKAFNGSIDIGKGLIKATLKGVVFAIIILIYEAFNRK